MRKADICHYKIRIGSLHFAISILSSQILRLNFDTTCLLFAIRSSRDSDFQLSVSAVSRNIVDIRVSRELEPPFKLAVVALYTTVGTALAPPGALVFPLARDDQDVVIVDFYIDVIVGHARGINVEDVGLVRFIDVTSTQPLHVKFCSHGKGRPQSRVGVQ